MASTLALDTAIPNTISGVGYGSALDTELTEQLTQTGAELTVPNNTYVKIIADGDYITGDNLSKVLYYVTSSGGKTYITLQWSDGDYGIDNIYYYRTSAVSRKLRLDFTAISPTTSYKVYIKGTLTNCTCNYTDGSDYDDTVPVVITADDGYQFEGNYPVRLGTNLVQYFDVSVDKKSLSYNIKTTDPFIDDINLYYDYTATQIPVQSVGDFTIIYFPTDDVLNQLSKLRFYTEGAVTTDKGESITNLYKIPFDVTGLKGDTQKNVIFGNYDTQIQSDFSLYWNFTVSGGKINVPNKYSNVYDYFATECALFCPFFDRVVLEEKYVIGQTIEIAYLINLYNGYATLEIKSSLTNEICYTETRKVGYDMPLYMSNAVRVLSQIDIPKIETDFNAYVEVTRKKPLEVTGQFGKYRTFYSNISDLSGYNVIQNVNLSNDVPQEMQSEIKSILSGGVFI